MGLKKEGVSLASLKRMSKKELLKRIQIRRRQIAACRVQVATLNGHLIEGKRCQAQMARIKSKFKGVASYLKANAHKWKKKDVLEKLKEKKEGAQARAMARGLSRAERKLARRDASLSKIKAEDAAAKAALAAKGNSSALTSVPCAPSFVKSRRCCGLRPKATTRSGCVKHCESAMLPKWAFTTNG